jgi:hypothetical protein
MKPSCPRLVAVAVAQERPVPERGGVGHILSPGGREKRLRHNAQT